MQLEVYKNGDIQKTVMIDDYEVLEGVAVIIGRGEDANVRIDSLTISRKHALIKCEDQALVLESIASNSLKLNGVDVTSAEIHLGDKIEVGNFEIRLVGWDYQGNRRESNNISVNNTTEEATSIMDATQILSTPLELPAELVDEQTEQLGDSTQANTSLIDSEYPDIDDNLEEPVLDDSFENEADFADGFDDFTQNDQELEDSGDATRVFQNFAQYSLRIEGENSNLDRFAINQAQVKIGRAVDKCDIILNDPEVSGVHSIIKKTLIDITIIDQDSSNGTIVNGERVNSQELKAGDIIQIGQTSLFVEMEAQKVSPEELMPVDENQSIEIQEIIEEEVDFDLEAEGAGAPAASGLKGKWNNFSRKQKIMYGGVALLGLVMLLPSESTQVVEDKKPTVKTTQTKDDSIPNVKMNHSSETLEKLEENYTLASAKFQAGEYYEANEYLDQVISIDPNYKDVQTLLALVKEGYEGILRTKAAEEAEKERKVRKAKVAKILIDAKIAVKERNLVVAESLIGKILEIDPENIEIPQLKLELDAYKDKAAKDKLEQERKEAERKRQLDLLTPGKSSYLKQNWYDAINKLEAFNTKKGIDADLIKEATSMLVESREKLSSQTLPLLTDARLYKEGQDYKRAYEKFGEVLKVDSSNEEALNERNSILEQLNSNSKKIYREALISENLSLFDEAKEKFEQVQQISPINSEYYIKATDKLKKYLE